MKTSPDDFQFAKESRHNNSKNVTGLKLGRRPHSPLVDSRGGQGYPINRSDEYALIFGIRLYGPLLLVGER
jgi:hypothetical protein